MTASNLKPTLLAASLGLLLAGVAAAQNAAPKPDPAAANELAAARAELDRATQRFAEASRKSGQDRQVHIEKIMARKPVLGVVLAPDAQVGVRIAGVTPDSAAAKVGLMPDDRIVSINDVRILGDSGDLRMRNARKLLGDLDEKKAAKLAYERAGRNVVISVTPQVGQRVVVVPRFSRTQLDEMKALGDLQDIDMDMDMDIDVDTKTLTTIEGLNITPEIRKEIAHLRTSRVCKDGNCRPTMVKTPMLLSAFRWNGLNLASVDPQLGRYFGTDKGVLVLSNGELDGLQAGDVIQRIDGRTVNSPREAMDVLRDKPADAKVAVAYMRDRKTNSAQIKVPKLMAFPPVPPRPPAPPVAPRPPAPPSPMRGAAPRAPAPPAPPARVPAPPAPPAPPLSWNGDGTANYVFVSDDGRMTSYSWSPDDPEPKVIEEVEIKTR